MKIIERETVRTRKECRLDVFLARHPLAQELGDAELEPAERIKDHLVGNRLAGESFAGWLLRQVQEVLVYHLVQEEWTDGPGGWSGHWSKRTLESVELDEADRNWVLSTLGEDPEVKALWASVQSLPAHVLAA